MKVGHGGLFERVPELRQDGKADDKGWYRNWGTERCDGSLAMMGKDSRDFPVGCALGCMGGPILGCDKNRDVAYENEKTKRKKAF
jgi:hypothetical protein